jgi:hypothetical protein
MSHAPHALDRDAAVRTVTAELESWLSLYAETNGIKVTMPPKVAAAAAAGTGAAAGVAPTAAWSEAPINGAASAGAAAGAGAGAGAGAAAVRMKQRVAPGGEGAAATIKRPRV